MADENEKRLRDYWAAWRRYEMNATAPTEHDEAGDETLEEAVSEAASLYAPAAQALWKGAPEAEVLAAAMTRYSFILTQKAVSRGACAVAIAVLVSVTLRAALGGAVAEEIHSALLAAWWWGVPTVWAGGVVWGARRFRHFIREIGNEVPMREAFRIPTCCVFGTWVPGATLLFGIGAFLGAGWPDFPATIWAAALLVCFERGGAWRRKEAAGPLEV